MEEAYQEYRQRQGQRAKALELKQAKAAKPGDLFQPTEEVPPPPSPHPSSFSHLLNKDMCEDGVDFCNSRSHV
jgi:hypothetical protein